MSHDQLHKLSDMQVAFTGSETRTSSRTLRKGRVRDMGDEYVMRHYSDDEPEPEPEVPVGYHEIDDSDSEA